MRSSRREEKVSMVLQQARGSSFSLMTWTCPRKKLMELSHQLRSWDNGWTTRDGMTELRNQNHSKCDKCFLQVAEECCNLQIRENKYISIYIYKFYYIHLFSWSYCNSGARYFKYLFTKNYDIMFPDNKAKDEAINI